VKWLALLAIFVSCNDPKVYECSGYEERLCLCPNGEGGEQKCSRGPAFGDSPPPRVWLFCSCCLDIKKGDHGVHYINQRDASGCWEDVYDPSINSLKDTESLE